MLRWDVSHLQSLLWHALKGNSITLTLESQATETSRTSSLENQLRLESIILKASAGPMLVYMWWIYSHDPYLILFALKFPFLRLPKTFLEKSSRQQITVPRISMLNITSWGRYSIKSSHSQLSEALKEQAVPLLWQKAWASNIFLHFPEREGREGSKTKK